MRRYRLVEGTGRITPPVSIKLTIVESGNAGQGASIIKT